MKQFKRFCIIGGLGFLIDSLFFVIFNKLTGNVMLARLLSFWVAASATWVGNRIYTFNHQHLTNMVIQWLKHMLTAHVAGSLNLMIFWSLKDTLPLPLAFCLGIIVSLFANYYFSKKLVFTHNSESKAKEKLNKVSRRLN